MCNKPFDHLRDQRNHMKTHRGSNPYRCEVPGCTKGFQRSRELKRHSRTHKDQGSRKNKKGGGRDNSSVEDSIPFKWLIREDDETAEEDHDPPFPVLSTSSEDEDERIGRTERGQPINRESLKSPTTAENSPCEPGSYPSKPMPPNYGYAEPHKD